MDKYNNPDIEFDSLKEYELTAKKLIAKICGKYSHLIIEDDDKLGRVMEELMLADINWNGKGNKYGYRKMRVKWLISKFFKEAKYKDRNDDFDLHQCVDSDNTVEVDRADLFSRIDEVINVSGLTDEEKICLDKYYRDTKHTYSSIANILGCSKQNVGNNIKNACKKIHAKYKELNKDTETNYVF